MLKQSLCSLIIGCSVFLNSGCATPKRTSFDTYKEVLKGRKTVKERPDAVILVSEPSEWWENFRKPGEWLYEWVTAAALKDIGVKQYTITFNAKKRDLYRAISDPNIQTIVVSGHGRWDHWSASDGNVEEFNLRDYMTANNIQKKKGFFIRHTCGNECDITLGNSTIQETPEEEIFKTYFMYFGAVDIKIDRLWLQADIYGEKPHDRIEYKLAPKANRWKIEETAEQYNKYLFEQGKKLKSPAFGTCVLEDITKTRGYDFVSDPRDYICNPIPEHKKQ